MRKILWLALFVLFGIPCLGQSSFFWSLPTAMPNASVGVCSGVGVANPCPSFASIFGDSGLTQALSNPFTVGSAGQFGFWVAAGQYTIQVASPYNQTFIVSLGGNNAGVNGTVNNCGTGGTIAWYSASGNTVSCDPNLTDLANVFSILDSGGASMVSMTTTSAGASIIQQGQGTDNSALCGTGQICDQAPTSVTKYITTRAGTGPSATAIKTYSALASSKTTETFSTTLPTALFPALTGDVTNAAGSLATTVGAINGTAFSGTNGNLVKFGASNTPADAGFLATNVVRKDTTNSLAAAGAIDVSGSTVGGANSAGFTVPVGAGLVPTVDGRLANNSTNHTFVWGSNGTTEVGAAAATGTGTATTCTNQAITAISGLVAPTCSTITSSFTSGTFPATAHNLLSATHGDTTAASVSRGAGVFGVGASPAWTLVSAPAATGGYFKKNSSGDIIASTGAAAGTGACTNQVVTTENPDAAPTCTTVTTAFVDSSITAAAGGVGVPYAADTGAANALAITVTGLPAAIATGLCVNFKALNSSSGATTLNVTPSGQSAYGAINLMKKIFNGVAAIANSSDLNAGGIYQACYDGTEWVLQSTSSTVYTAGTLGSTNILTGNSNNQISANANLQVAAGGTFSKYDSFTTAGLGVPFTLASINQTAQTTAIPTATLCAAATCGNAAAGKYDISFNFWGSGTACSSVTAGSVTFLLTWTDENAVTHSAVALQMQAQTGAATTAIQASFPFQTALANEAAGGSFTISTNGTIIQYATGYTPCTTGTGTYNLRVDIRRHV